jgi:hypothetical protein
MNQSDMMGRFLMAKELRERLSHVLWIGGGTDSGKTSAARLLSEKHHLPIYHYDQADLRHHQRLAEVSASHAAFLDAGMDDRWVHPEPVELAKRSWQSFVDRFPLVVEDLTALSCHFLRACTSLPRALVSRPSCSRLC